jgi:Tfp pilus assembly protein PilV
VIIGQDGFSYTEVLVSMTVITVAVLGFSLNTISVMRGNLNSASHTVAANLAQDKLEQLSAQPLFNNVDRCPNAGDRGISASGAPSGIFDRCWTIKDSDVAVGLKEISVIVRWQESEMRSVALSTLVFTD